MRNLFNGKQVIDTLDVLLRYRNPKTGEINTIATGSTTSVDLSRKFDKIEVYNGIGNNKKFSMYTKQNTTLKVKIAEFDMAFLAKKFGSKTDTTTKKTFVKDKSFVVKTDKTTIPNAKRLLGIMDGDGNSLTIINTGIPLAGQCLAKPGTITTDLDITMVTGYLGTEIFATYETEVKVGIENARIKLAAIPELLNCEMLCTGIAYDEVTNDITHNIFIDLYSCLLSPDTDLSFQAGKALELDVEFDIKATNVLPDGTFIPKPEIGEFIISGVDESI